eukprot:PRCOL_00000375-RA
MAMTDVPAAAAALVAASAAPPARPLGYGTAGFRGPAATLPAATARCGALAALRSAERGGAATGLMVTASHNPVGDNGVKLADPGGEMLAQAWEPLATELAGAADAGAVEASLRSVPTCAATVADNGGLVLVGRDTRPSGEALVAGALKGIAAVGGTARDCGVVTTPQLHWFVREHNAGRGATEAAYYEALAGAFKAIAPAASAGVPPLLVDAANGVGSVALDGLGVRLGGALAFEARNTGCGVLNERCGADFVQKERSWPESFCAAEDAGRAIASVDGDADRLVYIWAPAGGNVRLLDGDKIAALAARHLGALINDALGSGAARVGVVQTAYANGASTDYIRNKLGVDVAVAKTGVKHLHPAAERFDVGIYFEANGHGTVLFSDAVVTAAQARLADPTTAAVSASACKRLLAFVQMINQAVGDAMSGILMVEAMLRLEGMSMADWDALYADLPSRQVKVVVANKDDVRTENAETLCVAPAALQPLVDAAVAKVDAGRSFVRPSGTEDIVRVYAEARTQEQADALAEEVAQAVKATCA